MSPQLWGVVIGGGIGIVTTIINLAYNSLQQRSQREFALHQSVYMEATDWAARGVEYELDT